MGSEHPRQGDRRLTVPVRQFPGFARTQPRRSFSSTSAGSAPNKVPKSALTPISRLKKFQKLRDRNLRKEVLYRNNIRKHLKMLENVEAQPSGTGQVKSPQMLKELVKLENGEKDVENGLKENGENGLNGTQEELVDVVEQNGVEENGEVRRSPRRSRAKEQEASVKEMEVEIEETPQTNQVKESPGRQSPEVRDLEVNVHIIESPASIPRRKSTPRRASPEISSTLPDRVRETSSHDLNWMSESVRISGRRPIRDMSPPRKRKSDDFSEEPSSKRMAYTPSVPSPGWRFLSPFSLFKKTPRTVSNRPVDDSLFVNVSTESEADFDLDTSNVSEPPSEDIAPGTSEQNMERPTTESPKSMNWLCRLM